MSGIESMVGDYYSEKLHEFGACPKGVDWRDGDSQELRFTTLCSPFSDALNCFSINDLGCGYGKFSEYLTINGHTGLYTGYDLSKDMVDAAILKYSAERRRFLHIDDSSLMESADITVASGIFNVKMDIPQEKWLNYILETLGIMAEKSSVGFSFNALTSFSDPGYMRKDLYYSNPCFLFEYCKRVFSRKVTLLHDYDLYEFTIAVTF